MEALLKQRTGNSDWGRWQNALSCFSQANTDSSTVQHQVECVHLCSAFEHLLAAKPRAVDVAHKFAAALQPSQDVLAKDASRRSDRCSDVTNPLRFKWMQEFYRIRGDFAHGKLITQQPTVWNPLEHLVLATIAFPLVAKNLLQQQSQYHLTDDDRAQIDIFEKFADTTDFLHKPSSQKGSGDTHWQRLLDNRMLEISVSKGSRGSSEKAGREVPWLL